MNDIEYEYRLYTKGERWLAAKIFLLWLILFLMSLIPLSNEHPLNQGLKELVYLTNSFCMGWFLFLAFGDLVSREHSTNGSKDWSTGSILSALVMHYIFPGRQSATNMGVAGIILSSTIYCFSLISTLSIRGLWD